MNSHRASVVRCASCAAPLDSVAELAVVVCRYCRAENHVAQTPEAAAAHCARVRLAAEEARDLAAAQQARSDALQAEYEALIMRVHAGEEALATQALERFEGFLRLQYAPTLHLYAAMDPDDPRVLAAMQQIDDAVRSAVQAMAEALENP